MKKRMMTRLLTLTLAAAMAWGGHTLPVKANEPDNGTEQQNVYTPPEKPVWSTETPGVIEWKVNDSRELFYGVQTYLNGVKNSGSYYGPYSGEKTKTTEKRHRITQSGTYTAKVFIYETDDHKNPVAESEFSDEFVYVIPETKLDAPTNLRWEVEDNKYTAVCDEVVNAARYTITLYRDGKKVHSSHNGRPYQDFTKYITDADNYTYTFDVVAIAADITQFAASENSQLSDALVLNSDAASVINSINTKETDGATVAANVATVKALDNNDLKDAMQTNAQARENLAKLENNYAQAQGIETKAPSSSVPSIDADRIKVVGAALNVESGSVQLQLREADSSDNAVINTAQYKSVLAFHMSVENNTGKDYSKELDVPVTITLPVPEGMNASNLKILHYCADGTVETIKPIINADGTMTFTITRFSLFAFVDELMAKLGDINGDGEINAKDRMYLARALAGWDGYTVPGIELADFNGDGEVNAKDRMYLARKLAGWEGYE